MPAQREAGDFRVLWIGDAGQLPMAGWPLGGGLAYGTSRGGFPDARDLWPGSSDGATRLLADAVGVARRGETTHLGRLLAPTGVRYLALPTQRAPAQAGPGDPIPADLVQGLRSQLDLKEVESDPGLVVYENVAWAPVRSSFDPGAATALDSRSLASAAAVDLTSGHPVLTRHRGPASFSGSVDQGDSVFLAEGRSSRWQLRSGGRTAHRQSAFGWANAFTDVGGGKSSLRYNTPVSRWIALLLEVAIWVAVVRGIMVLRPFRRADDGDGDGSEEVTSAGTSAGAGSPTSGSGSGSGSVGGDAAVTGLATSGKGTE
jgi:hypothetical protein